MGVIGEAGRGLDAPAHTLADAPGWRGGGVNAPDPGVRAGDVGGDGPGRTDGSNAANRPNPRWIAELADEERDEGGEGVADEWVMSGTGGSGEVLRAGERA